MRMRSLPGPIRFSALLPALLLLAACATPVRDAGPEFVVVRHAEKASDDPRDPVLDATGERRAESLRQRLQDAPMVAAYSTPLRRTRQTARPAAVAHGLAVTDYDAELPAAELAARLRRAHPSGTVLVVGHSNTVPAIVAALCGCAVAPLDESEYGDLFRIRDDAHGQPALSRERF